MVKDKKDGVKNGCFDGRSDLYDSMLLSAKNEENIVALIYSGLKSYKK